MGKMLELTAADGHKFSAYRCDPSGTPRGALIVIMEIFGVNSHIKQVAESYAADGYLTIAPAMFDRVHRGLDVGYSQADIDFARPLMQKMNLDDAMKDVTASLNEVKSAGKVGIVGYCWGGYLSWLAACRIEGFAAAVVYYGGGIGEVLDERPRCPVLGHFGEKDKAIPLSVVETWRKQYPEHAVHTYAAGHGFNCDLRGSFDRDAAALARQRTLAFFREHVG